VVGGVQAELVKAIAELVEGKVVEGVADIRDESDRQGLRVVVEVRKGFSPQVVLRQLFKHTRLQRSFSCNMVRPPLLRTFPRMLFAATVWCVVWCMLLCATRSCCRCRRLPARCTDDARGCEGWQWAALCTSGPTEAQHRPRQHSISSA
jgi:hypothetical protein